MVKISEKSTIFLLDWLGGLPRLEYGFGKD